MVKSRESEGIWTVNAGRKKAVEMIISHYSVGSGGRKRLLCYTISSRITGSPRYNVRMLLGRVLDVVMYVCSFAG